MIYLLIKGGIDQCKGEDNITFQTQINLDIGLFTSQSSFYYCDKHLVTIYKKKVGHSIFRTAQYQLLQPNISNYRVTCDEPLTNQKTRILFEK